MNKIAIVLVGVVLLAAGCGRKAEKPAPAAQLTPPPVNLVRPANGVIPTGWSPFVASEEGYTFLFPNTWYIKEGGSEQAMTLSNGTEFNTRKSGTVVMDLQVITKPSGTSTADHIELTLKDKKNLTGLIPTKTKNDLDLIKTSFNDTQGNVTAYGVELNSLKYIVIYTRGNMNDPILNDIVQSFGLINPALKF